VDVAGGRSRGFFRRLVLGLAGGVPRLLRRGRRRRRRDEGPDAPATVLRRGHRGQPAAHGAVHQLQRADAGLGAVLRAGGVLLQLPAGRRSQPLYARLLGHQPLPRVADFALFFFLLLLLSLSLSDFFFLSRSRGVALSAVVSCWLAVCSCRPARVAFSSGHRLEGDGY
jgi:hypothetical protein